MRSLLLSLAFLLSALSFLGCGSKQFWTASPTKGAGVDIEPQQAWVGGHKLWVRVDIHNGSPGQLRVARDGVVCTLPNGQKVSRASGSSTSHAAYFIPEGGSHAVFVEFEDTGFDWHEVPQVTVDFSKGLFKNEQPVSVPPMQIKNGGES